MARKRAPCAPLALALDGSVLLNVTSLLDAATVAKVAAALAVDPAALFIGTTVPKAHRAQVLTRIDDAAAEVAARIQAQRVIESKRPPRKRRP